MDWNSKHCSFIATETGGKEPLYFVITCCNGMSPKFRTKSDAMEWIDNLKETHGTSKD